MLVPGGKEGEPTEYYKRQAEEAMYRAEVLIPDDFLESFPTLAGNKFKPGLEFLIYDRFIDKHKHLFPQGISEETFKKLKRKKDQNLILFKYLEPSDDAIRWNSEFSRFELNPDINKDKQIPGRISWVIGRVKGASFASKRSKSRGSKGIGSMQISPCLCIVGDHDESFLYNDRIVIWPEWIVDLTLLSQKKDAFLDQAIYQRIYMLANKMPKDSKVNIYPFPEDLLENAEVVADKQHLLKTLHYIAENPGSYFFQRKKELNEKIQKMHGELEIAEAELERLPLTVGGEIYGARYAVAFEEYQKTISARLAKQRELEITQMNQALVLMGEFGIDTALISPQYYPACVELVLGMATFSIPETLKEALGDEDPAEALKTIIEVPPEVIIANLEEITELNEGLLSPARIYNFINALAPMDQKILLRQMKRIVSKYFHPDKYQDAKSKQLMGAIFATDFQLLEGFEKEFQG